MCSLSLSYTKQHINSLYPIVLDGSNSVRGQWEDFKNYNDTVKFSGLPDR